MSNDNRASFKQISAQKPPFIDFFRHPPSKYFSARRLYSIDLISYSHFPLSSSPLYLSSSIHQDPNGNTYDRLQLDSQFERWKFMQQLLDDEISYEDINDLLYLVLQSWVLYPITERPNVDSSTPVLNKEKMTLLQTLVHSAQEDHVPSIPVMINDMMDSNHTFSDAKLISSLETLLPDKYEEPDAYEGLWDIVSELHGEESVAAQKRKPPPSSTPNSNDNDNDRSEINDWDRLCLVARLLIHFDFLTKGIEERP